jgi:hypothetical protein
VLRSRTAAAIAGLAAALAASPGRADAPGEAVAPPPNADQAEPEPTAAIFSAEVDVDLRAGAMVDFRTLHGVWGAFVARADATPRIEVGDWRLQLPIEMSYRRTFPGDLSEAIGRSDLELRWRPDRRFRIEVGGGASGALRLGWPDQYQPLPTGGLGSTDRFSFWSWRTWIELGGAPVRHHHAHLRYGYESTDYGEDTAFDPYNEPTHLVPSDHEQHSLELAWHWLSGPWRAGGGAVASWRRYFFVFARDAGTGHTHAGPGGAPPNPLEELWDVEPSLDGSVDLAGDEVTLRLGYGHQVMIDTFAGYYSYQGPHVWFAADWRPSDWLQVGVDLDYRYRYYGSGSYAVGADHPALEDGSRRYDHRLSAGIEALFRLPLGFAVAIEAEYALRRTNFPDYRPGLFPASRSYDINWDYDNWSVLAGVRYAWPVADGEGNASSRHPVPDGE